MNAREPGQLEVEELGGGKSQFESSFLQQNGQEAHEDRSQWIPDKNYYFEDGSIVILAEIHLFRVHRGVLSLNSELFKDMFSFPQPAIGLTVDNCPLLQVSETADEIRKMMQMFYKGGNRCIRDFFHSVLVFTCPILVTVASLIPPKQYLCQIFVPFFALRKNIRSRMHAERESGDY
jgi:hypothetical protein